MVLRFGGVRARGIHKRGTKNKTEAAYGEHLELRRLAGEIIWYKFEGIRFRLTEEFNAFYAPDYVVMLANGEIEIHEVKGHWEEAAKVRIKVAADLFPFRFVAIHKIGPLRSPTWKVMEL